MATAASDQALVRTTRRGGEGATIPTRHRLMSGIWRPVWLEVVPALHVTDLHWTTDLATARMRCELWPSAIAAEPTQLRRHLRAKDVLEADTSVIVVDNEAIARLPAAKHRRCYGADHGF